MLVVDRPRWIQANIDGFRQILAPLNAKAAEQMKQPNPADGRHRPPDHRRRGRRAAQLSGAEGARSVRPLLPGSRSDAPGGRLLLVAPNIVAIERELDVDAGRLPALGLPARGDSPGPVHRRAVAARLPQRPDRRDRRLGRARRGGRWPRCCGTRIKRIIEALRSNEELSIIDLVQTPAQREIVDRITAVMSLLEGHADVVMDGVGPEVIPTRGRIRAKFTVRRQGQGFDKIIRKLLGLDAKMRQYRDGAAFCRAVIAEVGMDGTEQGLDLPGDPADPGRDRQPELWLARVHPELTAG